METSVGVKYEYVLFKWYCQNVPPNRTCSQNNQLSQSSHLLQAFLLYCPTLGHQSVKHALHFTYNFLLLWTWEQQCQFLYSVLEWKRLQKIFRQVTPSACHRRTQLAERDKVPGSGCTALRDATLRWLRFASLQPVHTHYPSPLPSQFSNLFFVHHWLLPSFERVFCSAVRPVPELIKVSPLLCPSVHTISGEITQTTVLKRKRRKAKEN